ncbi:MAG: energy transducer TonB, partial [Bdellovibrionales bacterium]|nr:energy transducer TonB [Bdellovibrionales bacterium]
ARDRITRVLITLDKNGSLIQVQVLGQSGLVELDSAAVDAFRAAAPFPNPPQGMVEHDGNIRIRWDFILEASLYYPLPKKNKDKMRLVA